MKFFDSLKMALHNLWHNKSRSILTVVIVFVVSALIMAMCLIGTNFIENQNRANMLVFEKSGTDYQLDQKNRDNRNYTNDDPSRYSYSNEAEKIMDIGKNYTDVVDSAYYNVSTNGVITVGSWTVNLNNSLGFASYDLLLGSLYGTLLDGRTWTAADSVTNNIWVTDTFVTSLASHNQSLEVGDTVSLNVACSEDNNNDNAAAPELNSEFKIAGIITEPEQDSYNRYNSMNVFISAQYAKDLLPDMRLNSLKISFTPVVGGYDFRTAEKRMKAYVTEVNAAIGKGTDYEGKPTDRFSCGIIETLKEATLMGLLIMGAILFLAFIILMLSIGSVANTIIISVDKNRKFIGLMKAMGLNNKGVKGIVYKEAFITITIGVLLAVGLMYTLKSLLLMLISKIMGGIYMALEFTTTFTVSIFVPIGTLLAFILFAVLFSKGALNKMGKADVMSVISEVA